MSHLDPCLSITPVVSPNCIPTTGSLPNCNSSQVPINICLPNLEPSPDGSTCVNDNARRPWPTPPPAEIGCNPVSIKVTNKPTEEEDPDQTIRLEGSVTYISGDACLPQVNLNLVVPPNIAAGGGSPNLRGFGYTQYNACFRIGPVSNSDYDTPQEFFSEEPGAASFISKSTTEMNEVDGCDELCKARSDFGTQVAKFNLIGPFLAEIQNSSPITNIDIPVSAYPNQTSVSVVTGWKYTWTVSDCVIAANSCFLQCFPSMWNNNPNNLNYSFAYNNKENVYGYLLTPGIDLIDQANKGYFPVPIQPGTQVLMYGFVPWGPNSDSCDCDITWFFSEQVAFRGECVENVQEEGFTAAASVLPQRKIISAGMFFGAPENVNRV